MKRVIQLALAVSLTFIALIAQGELLPAVTAYWFAWYAFHPETEVYRAE